MSAGLAHGTFPPATKFDEAIINAVLVFDDKDRPTKDEVVELCVKVLLQYERFSSIFDRGTSSASPCEDLDPNDMVRVVPVSDCSSDEDLLKEMESQACVPLAEAPRGTVLPWWEFVLLENTNKTGKSAVVWRIHHGLGDGISLVKVVQDLFINAKTGQPLSSGASSNPDMSKKFRVKRSVLDWISQSAKALVNVASLPIGRFDDLTVFRGATEGAKHINPKEMFFPAKQAIIPFAPMPLDFVKKLNDAASAEKNKKVTVNDMLFTVVSQAMHDYLKEENDHALEAKGEKLGCRTLLPLALPRPMTDDKAESIRNLWCFISCDLSVGSSDVLDRLWKIHESLADLKKGLVPIVSSLLSRLVVKLPRVISRDQALQLFARHSMVLSNVPGPAEPVSFANHEIQSVHMVHMNIIPQLSFLSYRGTIFGSAIVGVKGDSEDEMMKRRRDRFPLHVSNALVSIAEKLHVTQVPQSLLDHAKRLSESL